MALLIAGSSSVAITACWASLSSGILLLMFHGDFISPFKIQPRCLLLGEISVIILAGGLRTTPDKGRLDRVIVRSSRRSKNIKGNISTGFYSYEFENLEMTISLKLFISWTNVAFNSIIS